MKMDLLKSLGKKPRKGKILGCEECVKKEKIPSKSKLDKLWREACIGLWGDKCEVCGSTPINVHHIYSRANRAVRWNPKNGIPLCVSHHIFDHRFSAHGAPAAFYSWLRDRRGELWFKELEREAREIHKYNKEDLLRIAKELIED